MNAWPALQCLYLAAGGLLAPGLIAILFARDKAFGALSEAVPTFVIALGVVGLWPLLLALILDD